MVLLKEVHRGRACFSNTAFRHLGGAILISLVFAALELNANAQQVLDYRSVNKLERELTFLLLDQDLASVANQVATEPATSVRALLRNLFIYSRAGHSERLHQTLEQLTQDSDWQYCSQSYFARDMVRRSIPVDDLSGWRFYYERLCPRDEDGAEAFVRLWEQQGDVKELDAWLGVRSLVSDEWLKLRVYRLAKYGWAGEVLDGLAASVRANPLDLTRVQRYLLVNNWAGDLQDVAWLADVCEPITAYEHFELGHWLRRTSPQAAARLFKKALTLPFTERDAQLVRDRGFRYASITTAHVNWQKQFAFWTKGSLAKAYQELQRPQDAQPLVEELVAMTADGIVKQDVHELAGAVQAGSGQRVVEAGVLREEVTQGMTAKYWLERANYYHGRKEYELEVEAYRKALEVLPFNPKDQKASGERLEVVRSFTFSLSRSRHEEKNSSAEIERMLRHEFTSSPPETEYAFQIAILIADDEFEFDKLRRSLFAEQPRLLARLLKQRTDWGNEEQTFIERAAGDEITPTQRDKIWTALEELVTDPGSTRAYRLAEAMIYHGGLQRAVPLLLGYLKSAEPNDFVDRNQILSRIIKDYCQKGAWKAAEKLLFNYKDWSWQTTARQLGPIAVSAAKHGATRDALRLWSLKANLDRRELTGLEELSRTELKVQLRAFYLQMKKVDPLTSAPEPALRLLQ
jgi:tetratricopeptide (TPR) repeat protein